MTDEEIRIYIIRPVGLAGPVKIGVSRMPMDRLSNFLKWSPLPLEIVADFPGTHRLEHNIHACLARSQSHWEWFHPTKEVVDFVEKIIAGVPVHEAIDLSKRHGRIRMWRGPKNKWEVSPDEKSSIH